MHRDLDLINLLKFFCWVALFDTKILLLLLRNNELTCAKSIKLISFCNEEWLDLTSDFIYKFHCGLCNESYYGEFVRHLNVRTGEDIGISPLTKKRVKRKNTSVADHLLFCNHSASYDNFTILTRENKKFLLELKNGLLIMRDKPS